MTCFSTATWSCASVVLTALFFVCTDAQTDTSSLTASPAVLPFSGANVTIRWSGILGASLDDVIQIVQRQEGGIEQTIGWLQVRDYSSWESGSGVVTIPLTNMRVDYFLFRYVNSGGENLSSSNRVSFQRLEEHTQIHLMLTKDPSEMRIMWTQLRSKLPL